MVSTFTHVRLSRTQAGSGCFTMPRLKNDNRSSYNATFQPSLWAVAYACPAGIIYLRTWDHIYACYPLYACTLIYFLFPFAVSSSLRSTPGSVIFTFLVLLRRRDLDAPCDAPWHAPCDAPWMPRAMLRGNTPRTRKTGVAQEPSHPTTTNTR